MRSGNRADTNVPFEKLPVATTNIVLYGSGKEQIKFKYLNEKGTRFDRTHAFEGIIPSLERRYRETESAMVREELSKYLNNKPCPDCNGLRLRREARHVFVGGKTISDISRLSLISSRDFFNLLTLTGQKAQVGEKKIMKAGGWFPNTGIAEKSGKESHRRIYRPSTVSGLMPINPDGKASPPRERRQDLKPPEESLAMASLKRSTRSIPRSSIRQRRTNSGFTSEGYML